MTGQQGGICAQITASLLHTQDEDDKLPDLTMVGVTTIIHISIAQQRLSCAVEVRVIVRVRVVGGRGVELQAGAHFFFYFCIYERACVRVCM